VGRRYCTAKNLSGKPILAKQNKMIKEITLNESIDIIKSKDVQFSKEIIEQLESFTDVAEKIILYDGNTALPDLAVGGDTVIVNGNLTISGTLEDCEGVDSSLLIVLGNVTCKNLITLSGIFITGHLNVTNAILGDSLCDYALHVGGDLKAGTIIEGGHWFKVQGEAQVDYLFNSHCNLEDKNGIVKPNLVDSNLMYDITTENPEKYKGFAYVEMIDELQKGDSYNLPKVVKFIKQGGERFHKV
jgi:hypothetical protein